MKFEIGHVLFIDIVGYSKLLINEQGQQLQKLNEIVRGTKQFRIAEAEGKLLRLPTGDGGALVFRNSLEAPVLCAMEIARALKSNPGLPVRMGIHSGPVNEISDLNEQANIAGAGINLAQRVMDCGDAGHILLSKHVADDVEQYPQWRPLLHDLGDCEVKHGVRLGLVNLYDEEVGNPQPPQKCQALTKHRTRVRWMVAAGALLALAALGTSIAMFSRARLPANPAAPEKSIAVLPFENLSDEKQSAFFTDGVQDEILTDLARIADLKVISRTSVMQYKTGLRRNLREIGQQLGVAHLLEGSVQRANNRVRVNAQLIDARNDAHLWGQTYDRDLSDVFAIQSEIAKAIADQLQAKLSPHEAIALEQRPTADIAAFEFYSRAKDLILTLSFSAVGRENLLVAADLLEQAVAHDPTFFAAQCQLAYVHDQLYFLNYDHTSTRLASAEAAVEVASRLRPEAGEAHLARAEHLYRAYLDYNKALAELDLARGSLPNDPRLFELTGYIIRRQGKLEEGLKNLRHAAELDPRNTFTLQQIALTYGHLRRYAEEVAILDRALSINPDDAETKVARALVWLDWKADTRPLHAALDKIRAEDPAAMADVSDTWFTCALAERDAAEATNALIALGDNSFTSDAVKLYRPFGEGLVARMLNDDAKARAAFALARSEQEKRIQDQPAYAPGLCILGLIDAGLGRREDALRESKRAVELLPVTKDYINGGHMLEFCAISAAWVGETDVAVKHLTMATQVPGTLSYGELKLLPYWDPLRDDPRFEKIVASLAPKQ